mmetsp:Transcript_3664/g.6936  ORF Transcript_3664/g.6936 Transcript_3664/m.6936 type:complete len:165 (+) Transcript_3664:64-558(+)|eukprot:CAMPEP_0176495270 /NCGR_PEP_ID=MMETSP0200_2-20121128/10558_1 /TAXON_ID=947934 /ORGANISM="Chaetoceros sp., Strain GSL56" /LENGTH=164 /DNA_ID=CAMNT_0017893119 /DNA_START=31 /DNA_END=525 /DNA_ORIENTATION=+
MSKKNKRKRSQETTVSQEIDKEEQKQQQQDDDELPNTTRKSSLEDIDAIFETKKKKVAEDKEKKLQEEKTEKERRKMFQQNASSSWLGPNMDHAKKKALKGDRSDVVGLSREEWVDDGLGGVFDAEGFTGRKEDGVKVFKAHLFNKKGFGTTKDCPFDCDCCYI